MHYLISQMNLKPNFLKGLVNEKGTPLSIFVCFNSLLLTQQKKMNLMYLPENMQCQTVKESQAKDAVQ